MSVWDKLDSGLASIYSNYLHVVREGASAVGYVHPALTAGSRLNVLLHFTGDIAEIEKLGFELLWREGEGRAFGTIDLKDLERLAENPGVVKITYGRPRKLRLDKSVPDINANKVWNYSGGAFTDNTGSKAIVGIIDTGIDISHPFFRDPASPHGTRILRIWDPGLDIQTGDSTPDVNLLSQHAQTYGVEYDVPKINAALGGQGNFRHRDCDGHGTHVASIAAGNGQDKFQYIGVAPGAGLIVVKYFYLQNTPMMNGAEIPETTRFRDAVAYILNTAKNVFHQPVVINCSLGDDLGPHDGFSDEEDFVTSTFQGTSGQAIVFAAGNDGNFNQHARITFPGPGSQDLPIKLYDARTNRIEFSTCQNADLTGSVAVDLYYPAGGATVSVSLQLPFTTTFIAGPALGAASPVEADFEGKRHYVMLHKQDNITLRNGRGTINRNHFNLEVRPQDHMHVPGIYTLRIASTDAIEIQLWCSQSDYGFLVNGPGTQTTPVSPGSQPPVVHVEDKYQIEEDAGADSAISVASYDARKPGLDLSDFSSSGPLANYGGTPAQPPKPDLAAPGEEVTAAKSKDAKPKMKKTLTVSKDGTSMATPHVTGTVALMLTKDPNLTVATIISTLRNSTRPLSSGEDPNNFGAGRLDAEQAVDTTT
jgi:subtilisin family serine protease